MGKQRNTLIAVDFDTMKKLFTMFILFTSLAYGQGQLPDDVLRNLCAAAAARPAASAAVDYGTPYAWWMMTGTDTNTTQLLD